MTSDGALAIFRAERLANWHQTPETKFAGFEDAVPFVDRVGVATLFPASTEFPNLYHAYVGDASAGTDAKWDTPSGEVYTWRWELGSRDAGFYSVVVRKRPTWVSWSLLPVVLRLRGDLRTPDELYDLGVISADAHRITEALEAAGGVLSTTQLRLEAGFPTGKERRAAFLKAIAELDARLLLGKVFAPGVHDMSHALVSLRYPEHVEAAEALSREGAISKLLTTYLAHAVYVLLPTFARHAGIPVAEILAGVIRGVDDGRVRKLEGSDVYVSSDSRSS